MYWRLYFSSSVSRYTERSRPVLCQEQVSRGTLLKQLNNRQVSRGTLLKQLNNRHVSRGKLLKQLNHRTTSHKTRHPQANVHVYYVIIVHLYKHRYSWYNIIMWSSHIIIPFFTTTQYFSNTLMQRTQLHSIPSQESCKTIISFDNPGQRQ